ncbi:MAG: diguanylate cyclase (GGDEF)-like protein [Motiliproteus sp.]|jgi:diguanylate cyclase (GGDEF)-like protein
MSTRFTLYRIKSKLQLVFLIAALIFGGGGMLSILFFNDISIVTQGFVAQTLPRLDTANHLDMIARDIDSSSQRLINTDKPLALSAEFARISALLDRLEILTATLSQEGGNADILRLNRISQGIRTQAQLVFQLSTQRLQLRQQVTDQSRQTKKGLRAAAALLITDHRRFLAIPHGAKATAVPLSLVVLDMLDRVGLGLSATTEDEVYAQRKIYLECNAQLQQWIEGGQADPELLEVLGASSGALAGFSELFPLYARQLQMDTNIAVFLVDLEKEVEQLSVITTDYSRRVFDHFEIRAAEVLARQQRAIWLTLCLVIVASAGLFFVHRWLVIQGFGNRLARISEAMKRVPAEELDTHVPVFGQDEIADMARALEKLLTKALRLRQLASEDELTGISNRRRFFEQAAVVVAQVKREASPACVLMMDLDLFKKVNDTYGHAAGDQILRIFAQTCQASIRPMDLFARYGGEEFVLLLPSADQNAGVTTGERIRQAVEKLQVSLPGGETLKFTLSIGIVDVDLASISIDTALQRADEALYQAKAQGRNRLVCWQDGQEEATVEQ